MPPNQTFQKQCLQWGDELEKALGGRQKLKLYPASQLGPAPRQFDLARNGVADIAIGRTGVTPGRYSMTEIVSEAYVIPKTGETSQLMLRRLTELYPTYLEAEYPGLKMLWMVVTAPLKFHTAKVALRKLEDFHGLRIRYAGEQFADVLSAVGGRRSAVGCRRSAPCRWRCRPGRRRTGWPRASSTARPSHMRGRRASILARL